MYLDPAKSSSLRPSRKDGTGRSRAIRPAAGGVPSEAGGLFLAFSAAAETVRGSAEGANKLTLPVPQLILIFDMSGRIWGAGEAGTRSVVGRRRGKLSREHMMMTTAPSTASGLAAVPCRAAVGSKSPRWRGSKTGHQQTGFHVVALCLCRRSARFVSISQFGSAMLCFLTMYTADEVAQRQRLLRAVCGSSHLLGLGLGGVFSRQDREIVAYRAAQQHTNTHQQVVRSLACNGFTGQRA